MEPYSYRPLRPREIRMLVVRPGQGAEPLQCQLRYRLFNPPDKIPEFEALSYVWGTRLDAEKISVINNKRSRSLGSVSIGQNLAVALHRLRLKDKPRTLWCDSVCINQGDLAEREEQILRMGDIFTYAARVVVWLGPEADGSSLALQTLSHLGRQVVIDFYKLTIRPVAGADRFAGSKIQPPLSLQEWETIRALVSREWYGRLWVWQEIALANSEALIICGDVQAKWKEVVGGAFCIATPTRELPKGWDDRVIAEFVADTQRLWGLIALQKRRCYLTIADLVYYTRHCHCSVAHDRVYALLGLLDKAHKLSVKPNYTETPKDLYRSIVTSQLENYKVLDFLELCEVDQNPSWAADIRQLRYRPARWPYSFASSEAVAVFKATGNKLEVRGIHCGLVPSSTTYELVACDAFSIQRVVGDLSRDLLGHVLDDWDIESVRALCDTLFDTKIKDAGSLIRFDEALQILKKMGRWL
ncbi:heterokaryon incompatibility protein-domain-containing protein [Hypoxylon sp. FL0890]|nr:heterokaryon incompatibility protein-domain-containing protein [Hypoxylon sp. FL0890]